MPSRKLPFLGSVLLIAAALVGSGCTPEPSAAAREPELAAWRALGSWSGRGSAQTESFLFESGSLRVRWQINAAGSTTTGTFRLSLHSAVSGRELAVVVDHHGAGHGESYVIEDPRSAYMRVESQNVDWFFSVEEGVTGTVVKSVTAAASSLRP